MNSQMNPMEQQVPLCLNLCAPVTAVMQAMAQRFAIENDKAQMMSDQFDELFDRRVPNLLAMSY